MEQVFVISTLLDIDMFKSLLGLLFVLMVVLGVYEVADKLNDLGEEK